LGLRRRGFRRNADANALEGKVRRLMLNKSQWWVFCALGVLSLVLVAANLGLQEANRAAQASVSARAQYLQQTGAVRDLYQEIAKALAELALRNHDEAVESMLAGEGLHITPASAGADAPNVVAK
jgi:hypothetical protein